MPSDLEPPIHARRLPNSAVRNRAESRRRIDGLVTSLKPKLEGHLASYDMVLNALVKAHRDLVDDTDIDMSGPTRWSALLQLSAWSLGLARALVVQLRAGLDDVVVPTARSLHETNRLLFAFCHPEGDDLLRQWLVDASWVRPRATRAVAERIEARIAEEMRAAGRNSLPSTASATDSIYDSQSRAAHIRRCVLARSLSEPLREFIYGTCPDPDRHAAVVQWGGLMIEEVVLMVGGALMRVRGGEFFRAEIVPLQKALHAVWETMPLRP